MENSGGTTRLGRMPLNIMMVKLEAVLPVGASTFEHVPT
jgi:hypothetical protein